MLSTLLARHVTRRLTTHSIRFASSQPPPSSSPPQAPRTDSAARSNAEPGGTTSSALPSLDFVPEVEAGRTGARSSKDSLSTIEKRRRALGRASLVLVALGLGINAFYMGREWDEEELRKRKATGEDAPSTRWLRMKHRFMDLFDYFNKPIWSELLPPPLPAPHQKPYTLLLSIDDLLVTSTWDRQHGWRTAKRPGVDYFLAYISQFYEVVIFTAQHHYTAIPVLEKLDRYNFFINYKLFREATRSINGKIVKDLSYLNRDLSKVVMLDTDPDHVSTHPQNAIVLPKWKGDPKDRGLIEMIPFLESIGIYKPADVRPILVAYQGKNIPVEYAKKEAEAKQKHIEEFEKNGKGRSTSSFTLSGLFGSSSSSPTSIPPTYLEQKRREAQLQYKEEQAYIEANKAEFERLLQADAEAAAKEGPSNLLEALNLYKKKEETKEEPAQPPTKKSAPS